MNSHNIVGVRLSLRKEQGINFDCSSLEVYSHNLGIATNLHLEPNQIKHRVFLELSVPLNVARVNQEMPKTIELWKR